MVIHFWDIMLKYEIQRTKRRIKFAENNGIGKMAMEEKARLKTQEKKRDDRV